MWIITVHNAERILLSLATCSRSASASIHTSLANSRVRALSKTSLMHKAKDFSVTNCFNKCFVPLRVESATPTSPKCLRNGLDTARIPAHKRMLLGLDSIRAM